MTARIALPAVVVCALFVGCSESSDTKPFPTTSQSPAIPLPPSLKAPSPEGQPAGEAKPDKN